MTTLLKTFIRLINQCLRSLFLLFIIHPASGQQLTQTIRGTVIDKVSQSPMPGAVITLLNSSPLKGTSTDVNGKFTLTDIPIGRQSIKVTYIGYKESVTPNITVNSAKEVVLTISLEEDILKSQDVVITAKVEKHKPLNEMSAVSTRTFSVEETQKFAAAVNDPARMATSFAGVVSGNDGSNIISVRGNSPNGLLWRMEGVDIPNPNHFSNVGTSGGGISILSAQLLGNSDFMTGAFASEYGNAVAGVFDLKLRKGNNQKREHTFQAGVLGIDVASEGPIKKGYDGSYLINYRYSSLSMLSLIGVNIGDGVTKFQDLSFNVSLPTKKFGTFGVFGFGGLSSQVTTGVEDSTVWKEESFKRYNSNFTANTGTVGFNNLKLIGNKTYVKTTLLASGTKNSYEEDKYTNTYESYREYEQSFIQNRIALSSTLTHKLNAKNSLRAGFILSGLHYDLSKRAHIDSLNRVETYLNNSGNTSTVQTYAQWQHKINNKLTTNVGAHFLLLNLNNTYSFEPRASIKYDISVKENISLGYGLHGQIQPLGSYFSQSTATGNLLINKNLEMTKAHHFVLAHDISLNEHTHFKTEAYFQYLFNVPISRNPNNTFSMLNEVEGFETDPLVNKGLGKNYGLEFTLEQFMHRNFYYLLSVSLYQSKYRAANNQWYDTRFNANYATTFTAGKEWQLSPKHKSKIIGLNTKLIYVGGMRYTPLDANASLAKQEAVYQEMNPYTVKNPDYFRVDIRVSLKRNYAKTTTTLSLDLQNATNRLNAGGQYYDEGSNSIKYWTQTGMIPILAYRIEF
jgi:hypothetical protein